MVSKYARELMMARLNGFHPVRYYLDGLKWDGTPRLDTWLVAYGGAEDNAYVRAVGAPQLTEMEAFEGAEMRR